MSYTITYDYINLGNARPGTRLIGPIFGVAHDTGNPGSTARQNRNYFNSQQPSASAHVFIDDQEILVIIPLDEAAYHVQYNKPLDNLRFGEDANDAAIGVELCWGGSINFQEAYKRYVWFWAWLCVRNNWNPKVKIASHKQLDPQRRTDPDQALSQYGISFEQFLEDVEIEINKTLLAPPSQKKVLWDGLELKKGQIGRITILKPINLWKRDRLNQIERVRILQPGEVYRVYGYDQLYGGQYAVGAGLWVTNMAGYIKYETPSKSKLNELN